LGSAKDELLYIEAVRALTDPIFVVTSESIVLDANPAALRITGLKAIEPGTRLTSMVENPEAEIASILRSWARSRSPLPGKLTWRTTEGMQSLQSEGRCGRPAAEDQPAIVIIHCRAPSDELANRFLMFNHQLEMLRKEVSARSEVQSQLNTALAARDDFVAVAAHELRNPLNVFHLTLQLLHRISGDPNSGPRAREILNKSRNQIDRLSALVDRLLDVTRIRSGRFELRLAAFDLGDLVKEVATRAAEQHPNLPMTLELDDNVVGFWDRLRIDQAITNLLSNAIKYGRNKPIRVKVTAVDEEAIVSVADQGTGISPEDLARIFNRFERAVSQSNKEGLGLGLWITKRIVQAHGGSISAAGELGTGSVFTLRMPLNAQKP
jgi:signal transduction histidine kinase